VYRDDRIHIQCGAEKGYRRKAWGVYPKRRYDTLERVSSLLWYYQESTMWI